MSLRTRQSTVNTMQPRVLHVLQSLECGGMEQVVVDLLRMSQETGHRAEVLCTERLGDLAGGLKDAGIPVHCVHKPAGLHLSIRRELTRLLQAVRPDVIHTHQIGALFYIGPPARKCGVKAILHTEHGKEYCDRWRTRWVGRLAARQATRFCCVSEDTAAHVLSNWIVPRKKIQIVYNGIDVERFRPARDAREQVRTSLGIAPDALVLGTVGRLSTIKRQDLLIEAFAIVSKQCPAANLIVVGDGPERSKLASLIADRGLQSRVHLVGYQADRENYFSALDVFALTSDSEGTPLALLEAWSANLPVVVTSVGGMPELVQENVTGRLVPPNDKERLAAVFVELARDAAHRQLLGHAGHALVRARFDRRVMAANYADLYRELLAEA